MSFALQQICRRILLVVTASASLSVALQAQTNNGRISGTVVDISGALTPGVTVTVRNEMTRLTRVGATNGSGFYVVTNLPVGDYSVTAERQGFKKATKTGYKLVADGRLTVSFRLEPGLVSESVEVIAAPGETINSTSGEVARVIDGAQAQELALNGRNYMQLAALIPGAPLLSDDQLALMVDLSGRQPINGQRGNANSLSIDGGSNLDSGDNGAQNNNVGIDFIKEVNIKTSNFSAEYGRQSGAAINVVTRSGGNQIHGSLYQYLRNDIFDANNSLNKARGVRLAALRYNDFGFSFGGPVVKDRFFFFGGMEWKLIRRFSNRDLIIPSELERRGDFSVRRSGPDGIAGTTDDDVLRDPASALPCTAPVITGAVITRPADRRGCFPNNTIPANRVTADGRAFIAIFDAMQQKAAAYNDSLLRSNNTLFQEPNPFDFRQEMFRLDYRFNPEHSLSGRFLHDENDVIDPYGTFINSSLPTTPTRRHRPGYGVQVSHTWRMAPVFVNEATINASWNEQRVPPIGESWKRETYGFAFQQIFAGGGRYEESIPIVEISGFSSFRGASGSPVSPVTDIAVSDNLTRVGGAHTVKTGLLVVRNRKDQNGRPEYAGRLNFNASGNPNTTSSAFADALLGNFRTYSEADADPVGFFRFSQIEAFVSDNWKVSRRLNLEAGLRYQYGQPTYTQANNIVNFDPALYDPKLAVTVLGNGTIDPSKGGARFNGLARAGDGVPASELGRAPNGRSQEVLSAPAGAPRGLYRAQHLVAPRFSFAFAPSNDNRTAIRGGFGLFYDRPEGNLIIPAVNIPPFVRSAQYENGNLASIASARASAPAPFSRIETIDPKLALPYTMNFSLGVQRELPWGVFGEVAYVGNLGRRLLRQPDINQPSFDAMRANAAAPSSQRVSVNALRPYKGFSEIRMYLSDTNSNYNSLQIYATRRKGDLTMTVSYTFSKALADASNNSDNLEDPFDRSFNYGPTSFDVRHIFVTTWTWRSPFFRKTRGFPNHFLGGWEVSGITRRQTGRYFTPAGNTSIGSRRADYVGGKTELPRGERDIAWWFNTEAFNPAPDDRRGTAGVGMIEGPGRYSWDLALRKKLSVTEKVNVQLQADFFNAFNQVQLGSGGGGGLEVNISSNNRGSLSAVAPGRNIQFGLRLTF